MFAIVSDTGFFWDCYFTFIFSPLFFPLCFSDRLFCSRSSWALLHHLTNSHTLQVTLLCTTLLSFNLTLCVLLLTSFLLRIVFSVSLLLVLFLSREFASLLLPFSILLMAPVFFLSLPFIAIYIYKKSFDNHSAVSISDYAFWLGRTTQRLYCRIAKSKIQSLSSFNIDNSFCIFIILNLLVFFLQN